MAIETWTIINGVLYLLAFGLIGYILLDAGRVEKRRAEKIRGESARYGASIHYSGGPN